MFPSKMLFTYYLHNYNIIPNSDDFWLNVARKTFYAHTDFKKLEGTLLVIAV